MASATITQNFQVSSLSATITPGSVVSIQPDGKVSRFSYSVDTSEPMTTTSAYENMVQSGQKRSLDYISVPGAGTASDRITCMASTSLFSKTNTNDGSTVVTVNGNSSVPTQKDFLYICGTYTGTLKTTTALGTEIVLENNVPSNTDIRRSAYVAKIDPSVEQNNSESDKKRWIWATRLYSSSGGITITSCSLDALQNNLYVCGYSEGNVKCDDLPTRNSPNRVNLFVAKLFLKAGSAEKEGERGVWQWIATTQGPGNERAFGVYACPSGGAVLVGQSSQAPQPQDADKSDGSTGASLDPADLYNPGPGEPFFPAVSNTRAVVMRIDSSGRWKWVRSAGNLSLSAQANAVAVGPSTGLVYLCGQFTVGNGPVRFTDANGYVVLTATNPSLAGSSLAQAKKQSTGIIATITDGGQWRWALPLSGDGESALFNLVLQPSFISSSINNNFTGEDVLYVAGTAKNKVVLPSTPEFGYHHTFIGASSINVHIKDTEKDNKQRTFVARFDRNALFTPSQKPWTPSAKMLVRPEDFVNSAPSSLFYSSFTDSLLLTAMSRPFFVDPLLVYNTSAPENLPVRSLFVEAGPTLNPLLASTFELFSSFISDQNNNATTWSVVADSFGNAHVGGGFLKSMQWKAFDPVSKTLVPEGQAKTINEDVEESAISRFSFPSSLRSLPFSSLSFEQQKVQNEETCLHQKKTFMHKKQALSKATVTSVTRANRNGQDCCNHKNDENTIITFLEQDQDLCKDLQKDLFVSKSPVVITPGQIIINNGATENQEGGGQTSSNGSIIGVSQNTGGPGATVSVTIQGLTTVPFLVTPGSRYYSFTDGSLVRTVTPYFIGIGVSPNQILLRLS